ncbi:Hypothetical predicted protein [Octopus vulgaris]|uniref:Uncharacterized protein n=1 Tax=Octopus vulgaris TaxID=6645 RepID=A0AA36EZR9_OCTVU|nr:Hypothetical predicted protein [Octopus vulgaris]
MAIGIFYKLSNKCEDIDEKRECKRDAKNLYHKLVKLEYAILTVVWEVVMNCVNKTSKKHRIPGSDVIEGYLLLASLFSFVKEIRENSADKIARYATIAKVFVGCGDGGGDYGGSCNVGVILLL